MTMPVSSTKPWCLPTHPAPAQAQAPAQARAPRPRAPAPRLRAPAPRLRAPAARLRALPSSASCMSPRPARSPFPPTLSSRAPTRRWFLPKRYRSSWKGSSSALCRKTTTTPPRIPPTIHTSEPEKPPPTMPSTRPSRKPWQEPQQTASILPSWSAKASTTATSPWTPPATIWPTASSSTSWRRIPTRPRKRAASLTRPP